MLSDKFIPFLEALKLGTEKDRLIWQDLPDEEMFRTSSTGGLIRIGKIKNISDLRTGYTLTLTGPGGAIAAELEVWPGEQGYGVIDDLYTTVRLKVRNGAQVIDNIINQSKAWK